MVSFGIHVSLFTALLDTFAVMETKETDSLCPCLCFTHVLALVNTAILKHFHIFVRLILVSNDATKSEASDCL